MNIIKMTIALLSLRSRKILFFIILPLSIFNALVTVSMIGILMPFMALVINPNLSQENSRLHSLYTYLHFSNVNDFVVYFGFSVLLVLIIANSLAILNNYALMKFSRLQKIDLTKRLFDIYLNKEYSFFLDKNSSLLVRNVFEDVNSFIYNILLTQITIFTQGILTISIFSLLLYVNVIATFSVVFIISTLYFIVYQIQKKMLHHHGNTLRESGRLRIKEINEAFGSIKLVKLLGNEEVVSKKFMDQNRKYFKAEDTINFIAEYPKSLLEMIAIGSAIIIIISLFISHNSPSEVIGIMAIYVFSGYRLMPALQAIFNNLIKIRGYEGACRNVYKEIKGSETNKPFQHNSQPIKFNKEIAFQNIKFTYSNTNIPFPKKINLSIRANTSIGLVGVTGSGKSTLVDIMLGLLKPQEGNILIDGKPLHGGNTRNWQKYFGYVPQQIFLTDDTIENNIAFGLSEHEIDHDRVEKASKLANLEDLIINQLPLKYKTVIGERGIRLSGGQIQRIAIARALYHDPLILVFDEATSSLDGVTEQLITESISKLLGQKTMIIIAHRLTTIRNCDVIYLLEKGEIVASGTYKELITKNEHFKRMARLNDQ